MLLIIYPQPQGPCMQVVTADMLLDVSGCAADAVAQAAYSKALGILAAHLPIPPQLPAEMC